jgi:hypothetical protein
MIVEVMEHIWQSSQKHTSGAFNIAEHPAGFRLAVYQVAGFAFPFGNGNTEFVTVRYGSNRSHLKENASQFSGVARFGRRSAPGQSLPLNMDKASLDCGIRPELAQNAHHFGVPIDCKTLWTKPFAYQDIKEGRKLGHRALRGRVFACYNLVRSGIHQCKEASWTMQKGTIQDKMPTLSKRQDRCRRWLFQIVIDHAVKLCRAVLALIGQLPDRKPLNDPSFEPLKFPASFCRRIVPANGLLAIWTKPALLSIGVVAISLQNS